MAIRISGLNSGLDTEAMVSELVSAYRLKEQKYEKAQKKLSWKQDAWKSLNTKVKNMYDNISNLRFTSAWSSKKTTISDVYSDNAFHLCSSHDNYVYECMEQLLMAESNYDECRFTDHADVSCKPDIRLCNRLWRVDVSRTVM